jgi:phosphatidylglycerol lysyltransferase
VEADVEAELHAGQDQRFIHATNIRRVKQGRYRAKPEPRASAADIARARPIIAASPWTYPNLLLAGELAVMFSDSGSSFVMYGQRRGTRVAIGEPVGPAGEAPELAARFCARCRESRRRPVFFEVREESQTLYRSLGLTLTKLGEEARVELSRFDLDAPRYAGLRQAGARLRRRGCRFEIVAPREVPALIPELLRVSEAWLATKATREKGISNARFAASYLSHFPAAIVRDESRVLAFANLWRSGAREELSVDLMRHLPDAPNGTMDFLFTETLLWGRGEGYRWFNFGVAPLSGLEREGEVTLWDRIGTLLYRHGEHFYNFRGLRQYKEKFAPAWSARYLASPGGVALPLVLLDVTALIAGGVRAIVSRRT